MGMNHRSDILQEAMGLISGDRDNSYGDPVENFQTIADFWYVYLMRTISARGELIIKAHDVAVLMALVKIARMPWTPDKRDHWADLAGYTGCGWDCIQRQGEDNA